MNPWQLTQQLQHNLQIVRWATGARQVVFGTSGVHVYAGTPPSDEEHPPAFPFCLVTIDSATPDEDSPDLLEQQMTVVVAVRSSGDPLGAHAVIGGPRTNTGTSAGAGIAEVSERAHAAIGDLSSYDGAASIVSATNASSPQPLGRGKHVAFQQITVTAMCTTLPFYTSPEQLQVNADTWQWDGHDCEQRYDFMGYRLGFVSGDTPVETADQLEGVVYTGTNTQAVHNPISGRTYQVFADYSPRKTGVIGYSSITQRGSFIVL